MEYEWNEAKAVTNLSKHGISFTAAARALVDPGRIDILDDRFDYHEERIHSLCMDRGVILFVVFTMIDDDVCRIISARKATRHEQQQYFQDGPLQHR